MVRRSGSVVRKQGQAIPLEQVVAEALEEATAIGSRERALSTDEWSVALCRAVRVPQRVTLRSLRPGYVGQRLRPRSAAEEASEEALLPRRGEGEE